MPLLLLPANRDRLERLEQRRTIVGKVLLRDDYIGAGVDGDEGIGLLRLLLGLVHGLALLCRILDRDNLGKLGVELGGAGVREVRSGRGAVDLRRGCSRTASRTARYPSRRR